jgi:tetratricopeptide (TPR) repeat protein
MPRLLFRTQRQPKAAIDQGNTAIAAGLETPEAFNNRGVSYLRVRQLEKAEKDFRKAIDLGPSLQTPHSNLALVFEVRALEDPDPQSACLEGVQEIQRALQIGPDNADLYYREAVLLAIAASQDGSFVEPALNHLEKALHRGMRASQIDSTRFKPLAGHARFEKLKETSPVPKEPSTTPQLLDPITD